MSKRACGAVWGEKAVHIEDVLDRLHDGECGLFVDDTNKEFDNRVQKCTRLDCVLFRRAVDAYPDRFSPVDRMKSFLIGFGESSSRPDDGYILVHMQRLIRGTSPARFHMSSWQTVSLPRTA